MSQKHGRLRLPQARTAFFLSLVLWLMHPVLTAHGADQSEQQLIGILSSNASLGEKDAACARLKRIGTAQSVPVLATLLNDAELSHSARFALESMETPEAGKALTAALKEAIESTRVGIINSLGQRGETSAVPQIARILSSATKPEETQAAARALGKIANADAIDALQTALRSFNTAADPVLAGLLAAAENRFHQGDARVAIPIFRQVFEASKNEAQQTAAYRGYIVASGPQGISLIEQAIKDVAGPRQVAAFEAARELKDPRVARVLAEALPQTNPTSQAAILDALGEIKDASSLPAVTSLVESPDPSVRLAALNALTDMGDSTTPEVLARVAVTRQGADQAAARQGLAKIPSIEQALLKLLDNSDSRIRNEAARALGERRSKEAVPALLAQAQSGNLASLEALALLAGNKDIPSLTMLVASASDQGRRQAAAEAINMVYQRLRTQSNHWDPEPLLTVVKTGSRDARCALLPVCSGLPHPAVRQVLLAGLSDSDPAVAKAAFRALCDTTDPDLLPAIIRLANQNQPQRPRPLAIAAAARLSASEEAASKFPADTRARMLSSLLDQKLTVPEQRMVLAGLAEIADPLALSSAVAELSQPEVRREAAGTILRLASQLPNHEGTLEALRQATTLLEENTPEKARAKALVAEFEARADYITRWVAAGPFREAGKDYAALFDIPFQPEANPDQVTWRELAPSVDPTKPWSINLLKAFGGEQCVAYARTWIFAPEETRSLLEMGSDDGLKIWINGTLVHANNTARPLQPGSDKLTINLRQGWNEILCKVTQNNLGWEFCVRLLKEDGSKFNGLRNSAQKP